MHIFILNDFTKMIYTYVCIVCGYTVRNKMLYAVGVYGYKVANCLMERFGIISQARVIKVCYTQHFVLLQ